MLLPLLLLFGDTDPAAVYNGRAGRLDVRPPRLEAELTDDGTLDEPAWAAAAMLTGFSQFTPVDGVAASDSTEVLVWYSATAIHFGIRAFEAHGAVRATLADRDRIAADCRAGNQLSSYPECCTRRTRFRLQLCTASLWYRRLLNGMRTSTSYPSGVRRPFDW